MEFFTELFRDISDEREAYRCHYPLSSLLAICLLGGLCGIDSFSGLADYAEMNADFLSEYLYLPEGRSPSHDTFRTILSMIDPQEFLRKFHIFTEFLADQMSDVIAIDGKTIRG